MEVLKFLNDFIKKSLYEQLQEEDKLSKVGSINSDPLSCG